MKVPRYALHKPSGQAYVRVNGKFHYLGKFNSPESKKNYAIAIQKAMDPDASGISKEEQDTISISQMVDLFLARNGQEYPANSREPEQFAWATGPLLSLYQSLPVAKFQAMHLDEVRKEMARKGWCREVINRRLSRLKLIFKRSERWGFIPPGTYARLMVITGADTRAAHSPDTEPAQWETVKKLVKFLCTPRPRSHKASNRRLATMLLIQWWSGCRPGEVRIMRPCDIDRSGPVWIFRPYQHKNLWRGAPRNVMLGPKCQSVLKPLLAAAKLEQHLFPSKRPPKPYSDTGYGEAVRKAAVAAGVSLFSYQIRHAVKKRVEAAHGTIGAKAFLGQESLESTKKYARTLDHELARKIAARAS